MCVASSVAVAARGDAAQTALDRKLSHYRNEFGELRQQNVHHLPRVWTADGRPHPAVPRTLQYEADIASSRNGQHLSAKSLHRRWKHGIQIVLPRRRAGMARAVLTNPSTTTDWLFAGIIDIALHHWGRVPALDGGPGDHDLDDFETDTAIPDDDDDTVSQQAARMNLCRHQVSNCPVYPRARRGEVVGRRWRSHATSRTHSASGRYSSSAISHLENSFEDNGVARQQVLGA